MMLDLDICDRNFCLLLTILIWSVMDISRSRILLFVFGLFFVFLFVLSAVCLLFCCSPRLFCFVLCLVLFCFLFVCSDLFCLFCFLFFFVFFSPFFRSQSGLDP